MRFLLAASTLPFLYNVDLAQAPLVNTDDPWGWGRSLEWATSCPPPRHNFRDDPADPLGVAGLRPATRGGAAIELDENDAPRGRPGGRSGHVRPDQHPRAAQTTRRVTPDEVETWIFAICAIFFVLVSPAYWLITEDWTGVRC